MRMMVAAAMLIAMPGTAWAQSAPVVIEGQCKPDDELEKAIRESRRPARIDSVECDRASFVAGRSVTFSTAGGQTVTFTGGRGETGDDIKLQTIAFDRAAPIPAFGLCATEPLDQGRLIMCAATYEEAGRTIGISVYLRGSVGP